MLWGSAATTTPGFRIACNFSLSSPVRQQPAKSLSPLSVFFFAFFFCSSLPPSLSLPPSASLLCPSFAPFSIAATLSFFSHSLSRYSTHQSKLIDLDAHAHRCRCLAAPRCSAQCECRVHTSMRELGSGVNHVYSLFLCTAPQYPTVLEPGGPLTIRARRL